jgi:copper chaperone CopZ
MSCQPCKTRVTAAVGQVPGVGEAIVDLAAGRLTVTGDASDAAIRAAVIGAGSQLSNA